MAPLGECGPRKKEEASKRGKESGVFLCLLAPGFPVEPLKPILTLFLVNEASPSADFHCHFRFVSIWALGFSFDGQLWGSGIHKWKFYLQTRREPSPYHNYRRAGGPVWLGCQLWCFINISDVVHFGSCWLLPQNPSFLARNRHGNFISDTSRNFLAILPSSSTHFEKKTTPILFCYKWPIAMWGSTGIHCPTLQGPATEPTAGPTSAQEEVSQK